MKKIKLLAVASVLLQWPLAGQIGVEQAVQAALQNHPQARTAALETQAKRLAEKSAPALENPEINAESPTGEFYTVGVLQNFEFPTVYRNRRKVAQAETQLAAAGQKLTENELRLAVRNLFLETQAADFQLFFEKRRDSLFQKIGEAAARQFAAGEIDLLQKSMAENEAGAARQARLAAERNAENLRAQLKIWTGLPDFEKIETLKADRSDLPQSLENPAVAYEKRAAELAAGQVKLTKSEALPNFSLGYLNQGPRSTPLDYRFRATMGVPLWFGQNRAARQSAETEALAARQRAEATAQNVALETALAENEAANARAQIQYFEAEALPRSRAMLDTATRLRAAGQLDLPAFLRALDAAFSIENEYVAQLKAQNAAQNQLRFLLGI